MSERNASLTAGEKVQDQIDALQRKLHAAIAESDYSFDEKRAAVLAERDAAVRSMIANGELSEDFWGTAVVSFLTLRHKENEAVSPFIGPYDAHLLKKYLLDVNVTFMPKGFLLTMKFRENPFFEETELSAEVKRVSTKEDDDQPQQDGAAETSEDDVEDEGMAFSGITWKPGHGPTDNDEEAEEDGEGKGNKKRAREGEEPEKQATADGDGGVTRGPSMLDVFSKMSPHPEDDEGLDDLDEDELAEAIDEWEGEIDDRKLLLSLLAEEMLMSPHAAIKGLAELESAVDELRRKGPRTEPKAE